MWTHFDLTEVDEDFARIAALGLDLVRVFLTWEVFAPALDTVAVEPLDDFIALLDAAHARGLRVIPTLFFGHDGAANRLPAWALDRTTRAAIPTLVGAATSPWSAADFYSGDVLEAQRGLARALGERAREHAALLAWDLGNAFSAVRAPAGAAELEHWNAALAYDLLDSSNVGATASLRSNDVIGPDAIDDLAALAEPWKFPSLDALSGTLALPRTRMRSVAHPDADELGAELDVDHAPFLGAALTLRARRAPMITAFGIPNGDPRTLAATAEFARDALDRIQRAGALGVVWWRWCDGSLESYAPSPLDEMPGRRSLGLIALDGGEKPLARVLSDFARERRPVAAAEWSPFDERDLRAEVDDAFVAYRDAHHFNEEIS
jgi:endo-1,4-beta-mannosidase